LATSFFNRYLCVCLFLYIYIFILFYRNANDRSIVYNYRCFIKWNRSNRKNEKFQKENRDWLCFIINFPVYVYGDIHLTDINSSESVGRGRPTKTFDESSALSKR